MKKRIALCIALAAVMSLTACGGNTDTAEEMTAEAALEQTAEAQEETTAATTTETTAETEAEPEAVLTVGNIGKFGNGSCVFEAKDQNSQTTYRYLYDMVNKKSYDISSFTSSLSDLGGVSGTAILLKDGVYNAETGEKYYEFAEGDNVLPTSNNMISLSDAVNYFIGECSWQTNCWFNNKIYIVNTKESFEGNSYTIGCMSDKGEWLVPMKEVSGFEDWGMSFGDYIFNKDRTFLDLANDKLTEKVSENGIAINSFIEGEEYIYINDDRISFNKIDKASGNIVDSIPYAEAVWWSSFNNYALLSKSSTSNYIVLDAETDERTEFDLTKHKYTEAIFGTNKFIAANVQNADSDWYTGLFDQNGDPVFEPIKGSSILDSFVCSDNFLVCTSNNANYCYNIATNTLVMGKTDSNSDDYYQFVNYDDVSNTLLIHKKDADGELRYYLADANDPMNCYAPF